jgi:hypothetical protein
MLKAGNSVKKDEQRAVSFLKELSHRVPGLTVKSVDVEALGDNDQGLMSNLDSRKTQSTN